MEKMEKLEKMEKIEPKVELKMGLEINLQKTFLVKVNNLVTLEYPIKILSKLKNIDKFLKGNIMDLSPCAYSELLVSNFFDFCSGDSIDNKFPPVTLCLHFGIEFDDMFYIKNRDYYEGYSIILPKKGIDQDVAQKFLNRLKHEQNLYKLKFREFEIKFCFEIIKHNVCCLHNNGTLKLLSDIGYDVDIKKSCFQYAKKETRSFDDLIENINTDFCCKHGAKEKRDELIKKIFDKIYINLAFLYRVMGS